MVYRKLDVTLLFDIHIECIYFNPYYLFSKENSNNQNVLKLKKISSKQC